MDKSKKKWLTIGEVAKILEVSIFALREWDKKGILKPLQPVPGMHRKYLREDVENFIANRNK